MSRLRGTNATCSHTRLVLVLRMTNSNSFMVRSYFDLDLKLALTIIIIELGEDHFFPSATRAILIVLIRSWLLPNPNIPCCSPTEGGWTRYQFIR